MKRKKWSEAEEKTLLTKYADLVNAGTLPKLKTREKKFKPIAEYVNQLHHLRDPNAFPFKWSWRDVSIKVQNMRHQYLGVKQKIRLPDSDYEFNWDDGDNHWANFSNYKNVFGDVDLLVNDCSHKSTSSSSCSGGEDGDCTNRDLGSGFEMECGGGIRRKLGKIGGKVLELRGVIGKMEEKRRRREFDAEEAIFDLRRERLRMDEMRERWEDEIEMREMELEKREMECEKRCVERWMRMDEEVERERELRKEREEKREEEEMEWREKMLKLQIEHEKTMMRIYSDACQNQMHIVGIIGRLLCQLFGSAGDTDGLGATPPSQDLQNMPGDMDDDNVKAGSQSPFL